MAYINILKLLYPVGSLYFSVENISPSELIGGSWVELNNNAVVGCGNGYFGSKTITINNMPSHNHTLSNLFHWGETGNTWVPDFSLRAPRVIETGNTGGGQDYLPYSFGCHIWYRTV